MKRTAKNNVVQQLSAEVDAINAAAAKKIQAIATRVRKIILPYFADRQLTFVAGNGTWFVNDSHGGFVDDDALPPAIRDLLMIEVARGDNLGLYINDIQPIHWKGRS